MILETLPTVQALSPSQKRILAEELWEQAIPAQPLTDDDDALERLLNARVQSGQEGASRSAPWSEVRERLNRMRQCVRS
jgi:hypothetical protein